MSTSLNFKLKKMVKMGNWMLYTFPQGKRSKAESMKEGGIVEREGRLAEWPLNPDRHQCSGLCLGCLVTSHSDFICSALSLPWSMNAHFNLTLYPSCWSGLTPPITFPSPDLWPRTPLAFCYFSYILWFEPHEPTLCPRDPSSPCQSHLLNKDRFKPGDGGAHL